MRYTQLFVVVLIGFAALKAHAQGGPVGVSTAIAIGAAQVGADVLNKGREQDRRLDKADGRLNDMDSKIDSIDQSQRRTLEKLRKQDLTTKE